MLLRFSTQDDLADFLDRLKSEAPDLYGQAKQSHSQPNVLSVRNTNAGDAARIRSMAQHAKSYADVEFGTT